MKNNFLSMLTAATILAFPAVNFCQAPNMGTTANFVLFTSTGAVVNTGLSQLTGQVGSNSGSSTGFGNVNGTMYNNNGTTGTAAADLNSLYLQLNTTTATFFPAVLLGGSGQTLTPGVYSIGANATLTNTLVLDGQNLANAVFIIKINGTLGAAANSKVILTNGAQACNVFWKTEGAVSLTSGVSMKGNIIAHNAAISLNAGVILEGRALSTTGAISVNGVKAYTPIGCGSPYPTGPSAPALLSTACFAIFSTNGPVTNTGTTYVTGDVGSNVGLTTGYNAVNVTGAIHPIPDGITAACATDLGTVYNYLNGLTHDIELLYPAQFGNKLVLTPHTYLLNAATVLTDTLFLNAEGNANATFVIKINGAFSTGTFANVSLINGTQSKNVYWKINGAMNAATNSTMRGTFVVNNGAISLNTGVLLDGRALSTTGALGTANMTATMPAGCGVTAPSPTIITQPLSNTACSGGPASFSVAASGTALTYQWRKGTTNLANGGNISGATTAVLVINPATVADVATSYNVVVSGASSPNQTSIMASLSLNVAPVINSVSSATTVCTGSQVNFVASVTGTGLIYQWKKGNINLTDGGNISGVNTNQLMINPATSADAAIDYNLVITGLCAPSLTTTNMSLVVNGPAVTTQPSSLAVCPGNNATFNVVANGTSLVYQWRRGTTNLVNAGNISGVTSAVLTISGATPADAATDYNVLIGGSSCQLAAISTSVALTVDASLVINNGPVSQTVCIGGQADFNVAATGAGLTYQWRKGLVDLVNGGNISGVNTATFTINPMTVADTAGNYNVVITGACAPANASANAMLSTCAATIITGIATLNAADGLTAIFYPNPFSTLLMVLVNDPSIQNNVEVKIFNVLGAMVLKQTITGKSTPLETGNLTSGIYYYQLSVANKIVQTGKVVSE